MLESIIIDLLYKAGIASDGCNICVGEYGSNNRNYRVDAAGHSFLAKHYFSHPDDHRDRLKAEWDFLQYAHQIASAFMPTPIAYDHQTRVALFQFIDGLSFKSGMIDQNDVNQAATFFCTLNSAEAKKNATLSNASEACFSLSEHVERIDFRINQLCSINPKTDEAYALKEILKCINEIWLPLKNNLLHNPFFYKHNAITKDQYCISPSDFGFHNALKKSDGKIIFLDFEYAGWDDPAKMVCDFFSQIEVPVSESFFPAFLNQVMLIFPEPDRLIERALLLKPLYLIKWCCIVLNVFLPSHSARKHFSNNTLDVKILQQSQLEKAKKMVTTRDSLFK